MNGLIAVVGLSGVGKSFALNQAAETLSFKHLQAGALIKEQKGTLERKEYSSEDLRRSEMGDNQNLLIDGFRKAVSKCDSPVVLDAHVVVDTDNGLYFVESAIFTTLGVTEMVFLQEAPNVLFNRRQADVNRVRPLKNLLELELQQQLALRHAESIVRELKCKLHVVTHEGFVRLLSLLL